MQLIIKYNDGNGPVAWVLIIPTTLDLMNRFIKSEISEKELFELTPLNTQYEAVYLCSALVLEEYCLNKNNHPRQILFISLVLKSTQHF